MLQRLTDNELILKTKNLVNRERELLVEILNYLKEIDRRKLYLELGFSSLWAYCTEELGYSEAAAQRRIEAMRAIRELPMLAQKIETGTLSISNVAKAQSLLRRAENAQSTKAVQPKNLSQRLEHKLNIFTQLENKSQKQAEVVLASHFPVQFTEHEKVRVISSDVSEIKLTAKKELLEKLDRVKKLVGHKNPNPTYAELIELMADFVISKKDPLAKRTSLAKITVVNTTSITGPAASLIVTTNAKLQKNKQADSLKHSRQVRTEDSILRKAPAETSAEIQPPLRSFSNNQSKSISTRRKHIQKSTQRQVWQKAAGRCEFVSTVSGKRCGSQHQLEIDHKKPVALGGTNHPVNLRLLCRAHNLLVAGEATLM